MNDEKQNGGFAILLAVLIMGSIGVSITTSLLSLGLSSSRTSFALQQATQARVYADTCTEEALQAIRNDTSYVGGVELGFLNNDRCTFDIENIGNERRKVETVGYVGDMVRKNLVVVSALSPQIEIESWREVADF